MCVFPDRTGRQCHYCRPPFHVWALSKTAKKTLSVSVQFQFSKKVFSLITDACCSQKLAVLDYYKAAASLMRYDTCSLMGGAGLPANM